MWKIKVFGIVGICPVIHVEDKGFEELKKVVVNYMDEMYPDKNTTFKVEARRGKKSYSKNSMEINCELGEAILDAFPEIKVDVHKPAIKLNIEVRDEIYIYSEITKNSMEINCELGEAILDAFPEIKVDVHKPAIKLNIEVRDEIYIYSEIIAGPGGMPVGTNGKAMLLLSGGIDSPVAGYMISKRGVGLEATYFHAPPYTSERAKQKVIDLAKLVSKYSGPIKLNIVNFTDIGVGLEATYFHAPPYTSERAKQKVIDLAKLVSKYSGPIKLNIVNFTDIQLYIYDKCPHDELTIIMRRYMMKIAEHFAKESGCLGLITGESIGQVASQTMQSLMATNDVCTLPVYRPVIGFDKQEIVDIAEKIDTYETSILPFEDCCTIFVAKHPVTKPNLNIIRRSEENLSEKIDELFEQAIQTVETIVVKP